MDHSHCNFCGKNSHEVSLLIAGWDACICEGCIEDCVTIVAERQIGPSKAIVAAIDALEADERLSKATILTASVDAFESVKDLHGRAESLRRHAILLLQERCSRQRDPISLPAD